MAKLNRFIINTDYDSLKVVKQQEWQITIPSVTLSNDQAGPTYDYNFTVDPGVYFELFSIESSAYPGYKITGSASLGIGVPYDSGNTTFSYEILTGKTSSTNFRIRVNVSRIWSPSSPSSTTSQAMTITAKLNLLVPSEQQ